MRSVDGGKAIAWDLPEGTVSATAYRLEGSVIVAGSGVDLRSKIDGRTLRWLPPAGKWQAMAVFSRVVAASVDPLDPRLGPEVVKRFYQRLEDHLSGEARRSLNGFFTDELSLGIRGNLWHKRFADEFRKRKGYDLTPELAALFMDIGPRTPKIRLDYYDVMVALEEESYFKPIFEWFQQRGMLCGSDNGGRGCNVVDFGDYFRTHRWMLGAGNDQPNLGRDIVRTKVNSSISHLYVRPRTWLEGYYGSGWGTTPEQLTQASVENYALGSNLQVLHGLYYSTHGGWWEWAPPCNHFRMPYWPHMNVWMTWSQRLCYLLSQGVHRCDLAVVYPVAPMQAGMDGQIAVDAAFGLARQLFEQGIDFDFIDDDSLARSTVCDKELRVSGEAYRVLVFPAMKAVHHATLMKAAEFKRGGGIVIALDSLPEASDRVGRDDPELAALVKEVVPSPVAGGDRLVELVSKVFPRDFSGPGRVLHRKVGVRDIYLVCGAPENAECTFRAQGKVELWDPWTGRTRPLKIVDRTSSTTRLRMPLPQQEAQLIVFSPGTPQIDHSIRHSAGESIELGGDWECDLQPTMDNRFGDFRWPPTDTIIGAEARRFRYAEETTDGSAFVGKIWQAAGFDDSKWPTTTCSFGLKFWKLGPLPESANCAALESRLSSLRQIDPSTPVEFDGARYVWQPYEFSWRWGIENDPGHQGYHGLKGNISDAFIGLGRMEFTINDTAYRKEPGGSRHYLWTSVVSDRRQQGRLLIGGNRPASIWLNQTCVSKSPDSVTLKAGTNPLLLRYDAVGRGYVVVDAGRTDIAKDDTSVPGQLAVKQQPLAMTWHGKAAILPFDTQPRVAQPVGWYRFLSPPGLRSMTITACGKLRVWVAGKEQTVPEANPSGRCRVAVAAPSDRCVKVAIRIEQQRGCYGGAALPEPITLDCGPGVIRLGDWSRIDGLASYSGGVWYRKTISLSAQQSKGRVSLQLGTVAATAEVRVNGQLAGVRVAPPWNVDISDFVRPGENRIEILVYNTLANHYSTIPTRYRGSPVSGLLGPVRIRFEKEQP
jgi:hypothetical protein